MDALTNAAPQIHTAHAVHAVHAARDAHDARAIFEYRPELTASELIAEVLRLLGIERRAERLLCRYLADLTDRVLRRQDLSFHTYADELETARTRFGLGPREARERVRIGRALRQLPAIERALVDGELSYSRVREVTRVATPDTEAEWIELARQLDMRTLERRVAQTQAGADSAGSAESAGSNTRRVTFQLSEEAYLLVQRALEGARRASGDGCSDDEALEVVARAALAAQAAETGQPDPASKTPSRPTARKPVQPWSWDDLGWGATQSGSSNKRTHPSATDSPNPATGSSHTADPSSHGAAADRSSHGAAADRSTRDAANASTRDATDGSSHTTDGSTRDAANGSSHTTNRSTRVAANASTRDATDGSSHTADSSPRDKDRSTRDAPGGSTPGAAGRSNAQEAGSGHDEGGDADDKWWADSEPDSSDAAERERASELDEWGAINSRLLEAMGGAGRWDADSLIEATGLSAREVNTSLTYLQLGGRIRRIYDAFEPI